MPRLAILLLSVGAGASARRLHRVDELEGPTPLSLARDAVRRGDDNGDGMLDEQEFDAQLKGSAGFRGAVFDALDRDRDGRLDAEPFVALEKRERRGWLANLKAKLCGSSCAADDFKVSGGKVFIRKATVNGLTADQKKAIKESLTANKLYDSADASEVKGLPVYEEIADLNHEYAEIKAEGDGTIMTIDGVSSSSW